MTKTLKLVMFLLLAIASFAQTNTTTIATGLKDKNGALITGTVTFTADREFGLSGARQACCQQAVPHVATVTAGSFSLSIPNEATIVPANSVCWSMIAKDASGKIVLGPDGYRCVKPTGASYAIGSDYIAGSAPVPNSPTLVLPTDCNLVGSGYVVQKVNPDGTLLCAAGGGGGGSTPTGSGFVHVTGGVQDGASVAVDLSSADATGVIAAARMPALTGDTTSTSGTVGTTTSKVNGVAYPTAPSTNTVPIVTSSNVVTYEAVPNTALANSSTTFNGQAAALGSTGNVNVGAAAHSIALNQGNGSAITGFGGSALTGQVVSFNNAADPSAVSAGVSGRSVSGTTDTVLCDSATAIRDRGATIQYTSGSATAVTLPDAGSSGCGSNFVFGVMVSGAGTVTVTRQTASTITYCTGSACTSSATSIAMTTGQWATFSSPDNTNWIARVAVGGSGASSYPTLATVETGVPAAPAASNVASALCQKTINGNVQDGLCLRQNGGRMLFVGGGAWAVYGTDGTTLSAWLDMTGGALFQGSIGASIIGNDGTIGGGDFFARATGASNNAHIGASGTGLTEILGHTEHNISGSTAPTIQSGTCGTSPSITAGSSDNSFEIVVGTGGSATSCQVNFGKAFAKTSITHPNCTANSQGDFLALKPSYATGASVTFTATSALTASSKISGLCF